MKKLLLALSLLLSASAFAQSLAEQGISKFLERKFDEALPLLTQAVSASPADDQARYYLALTQAKKNNPQGALTTLIPLLEKDGPYYVYRVEYDADLAAVRALPGFAELKQKSDASVLATHPKTNDRVARGPEGFYLLHQGAKIPVINRPGAAEMQIKFISENKIYLSWQTFDPVSSKQTFAGVNLFLINEKKLLTVWEGVDTLGTVYFSDLPKPTVIFEAGKKIFVYDLSADPAPLLLARYDGTIKKTDNNNRTMEIELASAVKNKAPEVKIFDLNNFVFQTPAKGAL